MHSECVRIMPRGRWRGGPYKRGTTVLYTYDILSDTINSLLLLLLVKAMAHVFLKDIRTCFNSSTAMAGVRTR